MDNQMKRGLLDACVLASIQIHIVVIGESLVGVAHRTPLGQIRALENRHARGEMHGSGHHVIGVVDADNRGVRTVDIHDRIVDRRCVNGTRTDEGDAQTFKPSHINAPLPSAPPPGQDYITIRYSRSSTKSQPRRHFPLINCQKFTIK